MERTKGQLDRRHIRGRLHRVRLIPRLAAASFVGLATMAVVVLPNGIASAATQTVTNCNNSGAGSLRHAVAGARPKSKISFALSPACSVITLTTGAIDIATSLTIKGPGASALGVSGNEASGVLQIAPAVTATVSGIIIEDGSSDTGGGIDNSGTLNLNASTVTGNSASANGIGNGGGIYNDGTLNVTDSSVSGNETNLGGDGGGIDNNGTLNIINSTVSGNASNSHGVEGIGGGIYNSGILTMVGSTMSDNYEGMFLGLFTTGNAATATVSNSTLDSGISSDGSPTSVTNSTVVSSYNYNATMSLQSTIMTGGCSGTMTDRGYNIDDDGSCGFTSPSISDSPTLDSTLGALANNGGPTETMALLPGSPAIDQVPSADCPATDQRGAPRTAPCDIGAYDTDGNPTITKIKPVRGAVGTKVTIKGTHLSGATAVSFDGTAAKVKTDSSTSLTTKVPAGATTGPISVTTSVGGTVTSVKRFKVT